MARRSIFLEHYFSARLMCLSITLGISAISYFHITAPLVVLEFADSQLDKVHTIDYMYTAMQLLHVPHTTAKRRSALGVASSTNSYLGSTTYYLLHIEGLGRVRQIPSVISAIPRLRKLSLISMDPRKGIENISLPDGEYLPLVKAWSNSDTCLQVFKRAYTKTGAYRSALGA